MVRPIRSIALWALVIIVAIAAVGEHARRRDWREEFLAGRGELGDAKVRLVEAEARNSVYDVELSDAGSLRVRARLRVPNRAGERYPALLILGGLRTGRETLAWIGPTEDVVLVAMDYPYEGKRSHLSTLEALRALPAMRRAIVSTPAAGMLVVDYLLSRPDVDPDRLVLVGGSLGALFAPAVATDERFAAVALLLGGADLDGLLAENLEAPAVVEALARWPLSIVISPVEPAKYVGRIAPRPLLLVNATGDTTIPVRNARLLHELAGEPKTIRWLSAGHVNIRDEAFGRLVVRELVEWLTEHGYAPPGAFRFTVDEHPGSMGPDLSRRGPPPDRGRDEVAGPRASARAVSAAPRAGWQDPEGDGETGAVVAAQRS